ncbi:MAG: Ger(x)C family spore germination C-terminal domain-containing protein, partial [Syntrophomonadaceae bacterium]|nr:Ger(x)C family spore germination C-terminal domain-containing protein [Syntrophomonadaceae bacterium]
GKPTELVSVEAPSLAAAFNMINSFVNRRISLKHTKAVVFSEELAREGTLPYLHVMARFLEFRRSMFIAVARGVSAKELLEKNIPVLEANPAKYIELASLTTKYTAFSPLQPQFHYFYNAAHLRGADPVAILVGLKRQTPQGEGPPIEQPYGWRSEGSYFAGEIPRSGGNQTELMGAALFRGDRMVGEINGDQMTALMLLRHTFDQAYVSVQDPLVPEQMVSLNLYQHRTPRIKIDVSSPVPRISIEVFLEGGVLGIQSGSSYEDPRYRPLLEAATADRIRNDIIQLLQKTQQLGVDSAWLGRRAKIHFLTEKAWDEYRWKEVYPQASIDLAVHVDLRRFGLLRQTSPQLGAGTPK